MTLTIQHHAGQSLRDLWDTVSGAWRRLVGHRAWKEGTRSMGMVGYHRTVEVTHGASGWHVHLHVLLFLDRHACAAMGPAHPLGLLGRWITAARAEGAWASPAGQDFRVLSGSADALESVALYLHKSTYEGDGRDASLVAFEVSRSDLKQGRGDSRTPFEILGSLVRMMRRDGTVHGRDYLLWVEWESASRGRRQQTWSRGLRDMLRLEVERSDADIASEDIGGEDLVVIEASDWRRFACRSERVAGLLELVETATTLEGARRVVSGYLANLGVPFTVVYPSGQTGRGDGDSRGHGGSAEHQQRATVAAGRVGRGRAGADTGHGRRHHHP